VGWVRGWNPAGIPLVVAAPAGPADISMLARAVPARALPAVAARMARARLRPARRVAGVVWVALMVVSRRICVSSSETTIRIFKGFP